jgi:phosphoglycolate phosphatase-like HAD superfamily hydrolase
VKEIKEIGKKTGIVTGAPAHIANFYVEELMGKDLFDSLILARKSEGLEKKPSSQALLICIEELGTDRGSVIYTGNSEEDILMGKAADVFTVYVDREEWEISKEVEPSLRIHSLYELGAFI